MYETYFGLSRRPFSSVPRAEDYFPAAAIEAARQTLLRCVERAEGVGIAVGPSGTGKTLLCRMLARHLKTSFQVAVLFSGRLVSARALLQAILYELGQPYRGMDEGELRLALTDYLTSNDDARDGMVLVVDEAHTLSLRLMEEIRMIANLVAEGRPLVRPVLVGGAALEERLSSPKLDSFNQRVVARCYLEAFDRSETQQYIHAQLRAADAAVEKIISPEACQAVHRATDGIPRLVNQLCNHAMVLAFADGRRAIDRACIEEAWADLQQLPAPWNGDDRQANPGIIEFGGLDDEADGDDQSSDDEPATISMLHVAPELDEPADDLVAQVDDIQRAIDQLDNECSPAEPIQSEVEIFFDPAIDPFAEPFEEEEVIVDSAPRPTYPKRHQPITIGATKAECFQSFDTSLGASLDESYVLDQTPDDHFAGPSESAAALAASETIAWNTRPSNDRGASPRSPEPGPILIVEDDYDEDDVSIVRPPAAVARREYSRLFTSLRGSR